jgi:hypothetical protein
LPTLALKNSSLRATKKPNCLGRLFRSLSAVRLSFELGTVAFRLYLTAGLALSVFAALSNHKKPKISTEYFCLDFFGEHRIAISELMSPTWEISCRRKIPHKQTPGDCNYLHQALYGEHVSRTRSQPEVVPLRRAAP